MRRLLRVGTGFSAAILLTVVLSSTARACPRCCQPCITYQTVEKTVMVPATFYEKRVIQCMAYRPEQRECTVTVMKQIPETKQVTQLCTIMVPKTMVRQEAYTVCKPVWEVHQREITVMVPKQIVKQGVRHVCQYQPTTVVQTVCEDQGCWVTDKCGCCTYWQPNIVEKQVECTVMKPVTVEQPFEYTVTVCEPQKRIVEEKVCRYEYEKKVRDVHFTVCEPKQIERTYNITTFRCEPEQQVRKYTVMVPYPVEKEISVPVCHMVPKTVLCQVPVYACCN